MNAQTTDISARLSLLEDRLTRLEGDHHDLRGTMLEVRQIHDNLQTLGQTQHAEWRTLFGRLLWLLHGTP
jgi:prefoldin subunit 5